MVDSLKCPECGSERIAIYCDYCLHYSDFVTSPDDKSFYHKADFVLIATLWDNTNVTNYVQGTEEEVLEAFRDYCTKSLENLAEDGNADDAAQLREQACKIRTAGFNEIIEILGEDWWEHGEKTGVHVLQLEGDKFTQIV